jgi:hypothetical protein
MHRVIIRIFAPLGLLVWAPSLWAQTYTEPVPPMLPEEGTAIQWLMVAIFLVACLVVAFKPAKRANLR